MPEKGKEFKNIVIYIRTSTEEQNPENQLRDCESIRLNDQKQDTFIDYSLFEEKQSAWKDKDRPVFENIMGLIKARRINDLIVWDLDRLHRNRKKLISFFDYCKLYNCKIHSFRQKWLEDLNNIPEPFNEIMHGLMLQIMGWLAEEESNKKSDRVKQAVRRKEGKPTRSYKGNKWGRKPISTFKRNQIIELSIQKLTIRKIAAKVGLSKSIVHKTIQEFNTKDTSQIAST